MAKDYKTQRRECCPVDLVCEKCPKWVKGELKDCLGNCIENRKLAAVKECEQCVDKKSKKTLSDYGCKIKRHLF